MLTIVLLCLLASGKALVQGKFSRRSVRTATDAIFYNGLIFLFSALIFLKNAFSCPLPVVLFGAGAGLFSVLFQFCYVEAMGCGNVSLSMMIANAAMVFPIVLSVVLFGEQVSPLRILGIALIAAALYLSVDRTQKSSDRRKWLLFSFASLFANGSIMVIQRFFTRSPHAADSQAYVAWSYITAALISAIQVLLFRAKGHRISFRVRPVVLLYAAVPGLILAAHGAIHTKALTTMDSSLLMPACTGGGLIATTLLGFLLLRDKLRPRQIVSVAVGLVALVLMNL